MSDQPATEVTPAPAQPGEAGKLMTTLGEKLDLIAGTVGYLFPTGHFTNQKLAGLLRVSPPRMSDMRKGRRPVDEQELSILIAHCGMRDITARELRESSVKTFEALLRERKIGLFGDTGEDSVRRAWLQDPNRQHGKIRVIAARDKRAGLGVAPDADETVPRLKIGSKAYLTIALKGPGHLIVLNDDFIRRDIQCLAPSGLAPRLAVAGTLARVPQEGPEYESVFDVLGPPGWCRLFAFWFAGPVDVGWVAEAAASKAPMDVSTAHLHALADFIGRLKARRGSYQIMTADYRVVEA